MRTEVIGDCALILGDSLDVLPSIDGVNMVMTSPPYDGIRDYGEGFKPLDWQTCLTLLSQKILPGGVMVWNVGDQTVDGSESGTSFKQALHVMSQGLRLHDTMIYAKEGVTFPDANRYHPAFEYMFVFSNGAPKHFNGIKDWRNKWAGTKMHGTDRNKDGTTTTISGVGRPVPELGLRRNWWVIPNAYNGDTEGHPAPMPYAMAYDHIASWSAPGETVLDPFLGSGTTALAAMKQGRKFVGIEIDEGYFEIAVKRVRKAYEQPDMVTEMLRAAPSQASEQTALFLE